MPSKTIAITGGIGSGKSEVSRIIRSLGYPVYDMDEIYSSLLNKYEFLQKVCEILKVFPIRVNDGEWTFDHREAAKNAFKDKSIKNRLDEFTHPEILKEFKRLSKAERGAVFCEVPLYYESGLSNQFDSALVVIRPLADRIESVKLRGLTEEEIRLRIENQFDYTNFVPDEHTIVIENVKDLNELEARVKSAVEKVVK